MMFGDHIDSPNYRFVTRKLRYECSILWRVCMRVHPPCVREHASRMLNCHCKTANAPVALLLRPASSSWHLTQRSPARRRRTRFVLRAVDPRFAAFAPIVVLLYSRVAKPLRNLCLSASPR
jgi:hypothetical protein